MALSQRTQKLISLLSSWVIMIILGTPYAWPLFASILGTTYGWDYTATSTVLGVNLATFALFMVLGGWVRSHGYMKIPYPTGLLDRFRYLEFRTKRIPVSPRAQALASGLTVALGYYIASMYTGTNFTTLVLGYGFIMGAGIGMGYQVPLAVAGNWATDENRPRYLGGVVSGFGLSSILVAFAVAPRFADLFGYVGLDYAPLFVLYDPAEVGFSDVFGLFALIAAAATILSAVLLKDPPSVTRASVDPTHLTPKGMLKTRSYIINMLIGTAGFGAGIMVISFAKKYPEDAMIAAGIPDVVAGIAGIIAVVLLFFGNMYGRYFWGWVQTMVKKYLRHKAWVDDLVVAKWVMMSVLGIQALGMLALAVTPSMPVLLAANLFLIGLCFGGMFVVMPNLTIAMFGKSYWSANYPVNFLSYGIAAILLGIVVGGILADMSVSYSIGSTSALLVVAAAAVPLLRKEFGPKTENLKLVEDAA